MSGKDKTHVYVGIKQPGVKDPVKEDPLVEEKLEKEFAPEAASAPSGGESDSEDGDKEPPAPQEKQNYFVAAKGHVQRVVDVALLISNMSRLATVTKTSDNYTLVQYNMLTISLCLSMFAQILAGVCFFVSHQREINGEQPRRALDYTAYGCVGAVMVLNIFISTFAATWTKATAPMIAIEPAMAPAAPVPVPQKY